MDKLVYNVWLSQIEHLTCEHYYKLHEIFHNYENIYNASDEEIKSLNILSEKEFKMFSLRDLSTAYKILEDCDINGIEIIDFYDERYPKRLKEIPSAPKMLYVKGTISDLNKYAMISVVGTRHPTPYGNNCAIEFADELARNGFCVVSGMARGIDSQSHRGALRANGKTIAVLGCGVNVVYPPENSGLKALIEANGCVVSEFPPDTAPLPKHFPSRNRIISGMTLGTLVVEGEASSGSNITANFALEHGREVYCIPGCIDIRQSQAPNNLIKSGSGMLVTSAEDIILDLASSYPEVVSGKAFTTNTNDMQKESINENFNDTDGRIIGTLNRNKPIHIDEICFKTGLPISTVNQSLFMLELNKKIVALPGKHYILK